MEFKLNFIFISIAKFNLVLFSALNSSWNNKISESIKQQAKTSIDKMEEFG